MPLDQYKLNKGKFVSDVDYCTQCPFYSASARSKVEHERDTGHKLTPNEHEWFAYHEMQKLPLDQFKMRNRDLVAEGRQHEAEVENLIERQGRSNRVLRKVPVTSASQLYRKLSWHAKSILLNAAAKGGYEDVIDRVMLRKMGQKPDPVEPGLNHAQELMNYGLVVIGGRIPKYPYIVKVRLTPLGRQFVTHNRAAFDRFEEGEEYQCPSTSIKSKVLMQTDPKATVVRVMIGMTILKNTQNLTSTR